MVSDLRLLDEAIVCEGNVGIGVSNPERPLHIQGAEVHSGGSGAGYSFADRKISSLVGQPKKGERWVWYASEGAARLWSGGDKFLVGANGNVGIGVVNPERTLHIHGTEVHSGGATAGYSFSDRKVTSLVGEPKQGERWIWYASDRQARLWSGKDRLLVDYQGYVTIPGSVMIGESSRKEPLSVRGADGSTQASFGYDYSIAIVSNPSAIGFNADRDEVRKWTAKSPGWNGWITLNQANGSFHIVSGKSVPENDPMLKLGESVRLPENDLLVIGSNGDATLTGTLTAKSINQTSSRLLKENITLLSVQEAISALTNLNPVKFNFKADTQKEAHVGFIAEDVPELVAQSDRKTLSPMDIVAVLTKVVQEQQQQISQLVAEVRDLKNA